MRLVMCIGVGRGIGSRRVDEEKVEEIAGIGNQGLCNARVVGIQLVYTMRGG
jgi:hypothetical protein